MDTTGQIPLFLGVPIASWFVLSGVVVGAGFSFFGVWLTTRSNLEQLQLRLNHEKNAKDEELLRQQQEELYVAARKYLGDLFGYFLPYRTVMSGGMTFNQALDMTISQTSDKDYEPHRITMLLDFYFSELKPDFKPVMIARDDRS